MSSPDSLSRRFHDVAVGRAMSRACRRPQSIPSTSTASCDAVSRITPSLSGGQRKPPCSSRFQNSTRPDPSQARIFRRSARFDRKMKIVPENGSCPSLSRTRATRPSAPLRKSTGAVATSTRTPGRNCNHVAASSPHRSRVESERRSQSQSPLTGWDTSTLSAHSQTTTLLPQAQVNAGTPSQAPL